MGVFTSQPVSVPKVPDPKPHRRLATSPYSPTSPARLLWLVPAIANRPWQEDTVMGFHRNGGPGYSHTCCVSISMDDITSQNLSPLICKADLLPSSPWAGCTQSISLSPPSSLPPSIPFSTSLFFTKLYQEAGTHL